MYLIRFDTHVNVESVLQYKYNDDLSKTILLSVS